MLIFTQIAALQKHLKPYIKQGKTIGFVPTMGALHRGHIFLIQKSIKEADLTVCSIFVNPTQFNDPADFDKYPSTVPADVEKLNKAKCDILFLPSVKEMYPDGTQNKRKVDFGFLAQTLEGEHRPGHFDGMAQVVERLLRIVKPHLLYMGLKDYQQQLIVSKLIEKRKLRVKLMAMKTVRERDGLALSSRNVRLNEEQRKVATQLSKALRRSKYYLKTGTEIASAQLSGRKKLERNKEIEIEYFEIRNANTLAVPKSRKEKMVALVAAKVGGVRLIDNMRMW